MRITNNMMIANMKRNLANNQTRMSKYQNQLQTGKKIQFPSDDPVVAARALKLRTDVSKIEQYQKNLEDAGSWLDETDVTLGKIGDVLQKARELTVQAANGTNTQEETQKIAQELKQLRAQLTHLANSTYAGRYIFSGFKTDQKLIIDDENDPNFGFFNIDVSTKREKIFYEIGVGDSININILGGDLFNLGGDAVKSDAATANPIPGSGIARSELSSLSFPISIGPGNSNITFSINGGPNITASISLGTYYDTADIETQINTAINNAFGTPVVEVSINGNVIEIKTLENSMTASVTFDHTSGFFGYVGAESPEVTTGADNATGGIGRPEMIQMFFDVIDYMEAGDYGKLTASLDVFDAHIGNVLRCRADIGARQNRVDLSLDRMNMDEVNFTDLLSKNEDVDIAEAIMYLKSEENVYQASLAGGARIIQQTLVDLLR